MSEFDEKFADIPGQQEIEVPAQPRPARVGRPKPDDFPGRSVKHVFTVVASVGVAGTGGFFNGPPWVFTNEVDAYAKKVELEERSKASGHKMVVRVDRCVVTPAGREPRRQQAA